MHGQTSYLAPAVLHALDHFPIHNLSLPNLFQAAHRSPEEVIAEVLVYVHSLLLRFLLKKCEKLALENVLYYGR